jgi:hypothetical protein
MPKADTPGHTQLGVGTLIIDQVVRSITGRAAASDRLWVLVGHEIALVVLADLIARAATLCDSLFGDRFTRTCAPNAHR